MTRFNSALRMSVSVVALTAGAGLMAPQAQAVTITGNQTGYVSSGDITDGLTVAVGASVTPDGVFIDSKHAFKGDLVNGGTVGLIIDDQPDITFQSAAIDVGGMLQGNLINNGLVNASETASVSLKNESSTEDLVLISKASFSSADVAGVYVQALEGDLTNTGDIKAAGAADNQHDLVITTTDEAYINVGSRAFSNAAGVSLGNTFDGKLSNAADAGIGAQAEAHSDVNADVTALTLKLGADELTSAAVAVGVYAGGTIQNAGTISAASDASASYVVDAVATGIPGDAPESSDDGLAYVTLGLVQVSSDAAGIVASGNIAGISNSGTVSADATASFDVDVTADGIQGLVYSDSQSSSSVESDAEAITYDGILGGPVSNDGTIAATSSTTVTITTAANSTDSNARTDLQTLDVSSSALGVVLTGDAKAATFTNTNKITADASTSYGETSTVTASGEASAGTGSYVESQAGGVMLVDFVGFTNSGEITVSADSVAVTSAAAVSGSDEMPDFAGAGDSVGVEARAGGVSLDRLHGAVANSGKIAAVATASSTNDAIATATDTAAGAAAGGGAVAHASGVSLVELDGSFTNDAKGTIEAQATASIDVSALAKGTSAASQVSPLGYASSSGVAFHGGYFYDGDEHTFDNAGVISATSTVTAVAQSVGEASDGFASMEPINLQQTAIAIGVDEDGVSTGFKNSGDISAAASASSTLSFTSTGGAGTSVTAGNSLAANATGVRFTQEVQGDVTNDGKISASASAIGDFTVVSVADKGLGAVTTSLWSDVRAVGLQAYFGEPAEDEEERTEHDFTNSNTVTATGDLVVTLTSNDSEKDDGFYSSAGLDVTGVEIEGDAGVITNSGVITAAGKYDLTATPAVNVFANARVVGLWVSDADAGDVIVNTGKIEASLTAKNAEFVQVAGVVLGPDAPVDEVDDDQESTAVPEGSITFTNSGTITATTDLGIAYGVYAGSAPVPVTINQQGGSISGDIAIGIDQGNADTLNWTGGEIHGVVEADEFDVVNVLAGTGTLASKTISAGADFALTGGASLNIGVKDAPVTFALDGSVTGTGVVNVNDDGNLLLGPSATVDAGTFVMAPEATLTVEFDRDSAGSIKTTGDAAIDGKLVAVALPDLYGDKGSHTIIEAGGKVTGAFDNVSITGDTLLLDFSATTGEQTVTVAWERTAFDEVEGLSDNSAAVAGAVEDSYDPTRPESKNTQELNDQLAGLFTIADAGLYDRVLNSWSGSEHAQVMRAATNLSEPYLLAIGEHLNDNRNAGFREQNVVMLRPKGSSNSIAPASSVGASAAEETGFAFWGRAYGRWADTRGDANAGGFDEDTYGAVLGVDFQVTPTILLGIAGSYTNDDIGFDDGDDAEIERWTIGGYASATFDAFYIDASFTYASDDYEVNRTIVTGGVACLAYNCAAGAASKYDGDGLIVHAEAGFNWVLGEGVRLQPFAGLNYTGMDTDAFGEVGGGDLGLQVLDGTGKSFQSRLGARLSGEWGSGDVKWVPELRAEWRHEFEDQPAWIVSNLVGLPDDPFLTVGSHVSGDLAVIGAGITAQMANGWGLYLDYQGAFASGYSSHAIQGGARFRF